MLGYFELTRNQFLHDPVDERRTGIKIGWFLTSVLKISKSVVNVVQLMIVVIEALLG